MRLSELITLLIDHAGERLSGKTTLQKRAYFVGRALGEDYGYRAHYYGPYSQRVESATGHGRALGLFDSRTYDYGHAGSAGNRVVKYEYSLSGDGREVVDHLEEQDEQEVETVRDVLDRLEEVGLEHYVPLSIAAKVDYLIREQNVQHDVGAIVDAANEEGWELTEDEVIDALGRLEELELPD